MGYALGFRTFVLQGGEDGSFTDDRLTDIISSIRTRWSDCAITLSIGERSYESYKQLYDAGANRFLLRHETYDDTHYGKLHPPALSAARRKQCLFDLKRSAIRSAPDLWSDRLIRLLKIWQTICCF